MRRLRRRLGGRERPNPNPRGIDLGGCERPTARDRGRATVRVRATSAGANAPPLGTYIPEAWLGFRVRVRVRAKGLG